MTRELWFRHGVQYCGESLLGVPVGYQQLGPCCCCSIQRASCGCSATLQILFSMLIEPGILYTPP